jgi:hypothetical protein
MERTGGAAQELVPLRVAVLVVDALEVVEVEHQQRQRVAEPIGAGGVLDHELPGFVCADRGVSGVRFVSPLTAAPRRRRGPTA